MTPSESTDLSPLKLRLQAIDGDLTRSEAMLAQWLTLNEAVIGLETGASIAAKTRVSEITVSRFLRRLGYKGLSALKAELQSSAAASLPTVSSIRLLDGETGDLIRRDAEAVLALSDQVARPEWVQAIAAIQQASHVYVTGFQTVRGVAEDFARRLAIVRSAVQFLSPHDGGLAEWIAAPPGALMFLVDTIPYAREAEPVVAQASRSGMVVVVATDELNTWAAAHTPFVFHVAAKSGAFVESTGPLASLLNLVTHAVAALDPERAKARLNVWPGLIRDLQLF
ncbi:MAG: MurR/RpiR family transcriptional regulator [Tabrizicola sp.]|jgi:DNA-binding MurR/RpiR family transcriptional regulator|nr:MurR/RpiR family transcriptional regulator [Tabrizicola sp.]